MSGTRVNCNACVQCASAFDASVKPMYHLWENMAGRQIIVTGSETVHFYPPTSDANIEIYQRHNIVLGAFICAMTLALFAIDR